MPTKPELTKQLAEITAKYESLVNAVDEMTKKAIYELGPCDDGMDIINEIREEAGLNVDTTVKASITLEVEIPYIQYKKLDDNLVSVSDVFVSIEDEDSLEVTDYSIEELR